MIVTGDKDMLQLLTPHIRIYDPVKDKWSGDAECVAKFGVEPGRVVEVMGLMGDTSDNIPGVKGIGEKTAMKLIAQFGTIEEVLGRLDEVTPPASRPSSPNRRRTRGSAGNWRPSIHRVPWNFIPSPIGSRHRMTSN